LTQSQPTHDPYPSPGAQTDEAELREFARANLAHFKAPHSVTFVKVFLVSWLLN
jgi:hypothetical protein